MSSDPRSVAEAFTAHLPVVMARRWPSCMHQMRPFLIQRFPACAVPKSDRCGRC